MRLQFRSQSENGDEKRAWQIALKAICHAPNSLLCYVSNKCDSLCSKRKSPRLPTASGGWAMCQVSVLYFKIF